MPKARVDWFKVALLTALTVIVVWVSIILGKSPIGYAFGQSAPPRVTLPASLEVVDRATWIMTTAQSHPLCWSNDNPQANLAIRIYRYRVEGGPKVLYLTLPRDLWVADPIAGNYCSAGSHRVPKAGHWVYEADFCITPIAAGNSNCSVLVSAVCPQGTAGCAGMVNGVARGWWVYAYLPAPSGPVVN